MNPIYFGYIPIHCNCTISGLVVCNVVDKVDPYAQEERVRQECIRHMNTRKQGNSELSQKSQDTIVQSGNWKSCGSGVYIHRA